MRTLTIDPGVPFGWALFAKDEFVVANRETQSRSYTWEQKTDEAALQLKKAMGEYDPEIVYCERPIYMPGHAAADRDSLVKLTLLTGRFWQVVRALGIRFEFIRVCDWLGQMSDKAIRHRVEGVLGKEVTDAIPAHAIDAVGMGLYVLGKWPEGQKFLENPCA